MMEMFVKIVNVVKGVETFTYYHKKLYLRCGRDSGLALGILMAAGKWLKA